MNNSFSKLPIHDVSDELIAGLEQTGRVVLSAPTGSGKSTQVPQILLNHSGIKGEIVVLQPRRLATRLLAKRVAFERGVKLGDEVGYQIRFENVVSNKTRIRFVTEAILLRQILQDPSLKGVGALIFDEFHERHLTSDLSLACALQTALRLRTDMKLIVMSATLDIEALKRFLEPCACIQASGRMYPVHVDYTGASLGRNAAPIWERAAQAFKKSVSGKQGDILIFMPGAYEISKTIAAIQSLPEAKAYEVLPLHGELPVEAQERAIKTMEQPKVIVSTNVSETSITIEGVRTVIDGGLARVARYDPVRGINSILVEGISRASAEQRAGRAGRTGPGLCIRLWSEAEHQARSDRDEAEVRRVDLSEILLMLLKGGIQKWHEFPWYESPSSASLARAETLLHNLGAIDANSQLTDLGRKMADFPLHPRYTRLLIEGDALGVLPDVALIAALSQGRSIYRVARDGNIRTEQLRQINDHADERSDFFVQIRAFELAQAVNFKALECRKLGIHGGAARQAHAVYEQLLKHAKRAGLDTRAATLPDLEDRICRCILVAFSDQLCLRKDRGTRRCLMTQGRNGELRRESVVESKLFVAGEIEERELRGDVTVLLSLVTAVNLSWLKKTFPDDFSDRFKTYYDPDTRRVRSSRELHFRDLTLETKEHGEPDAGQAAKLLAAEVKAGNLKLKHWNSEVENWINRVNFVANNCPDAEVALIDTEARSLIIEQICHGSLSYKEIKDRLVIGVVKEWIRSEQHYYIEIYAPPEITLPGRSRPVRIRYEADGRAIIASKLQDFYDVPGSLLRVANGNVPLLIELLAPNQRPAHLTEDLDGFWDGAYLQVRKDLAGRYPKHEWR